MPIDTAVTRDLMDALDDSRDGYERLSTLLSRLGREDLAGMMRDLADQRAELRRELDAFARWTDRDDDDRSVVGALHQSWLNVVEAKGQKGVALWRDEPPAAGFFQAKKPRGVECDVDVATVEISCRAIGHFHSPFAH